MDTLNTFEYWSKNMATLGEALSNSFMLGDATVMLGPVADLYKLTPGEHSLGLVKNLTLKADSGYVELTQGVQNDVVHSTKNSSTVTAAWEVYEYSSKNLAYSLGLDGSDLETSEAAVALSAAVVGTAATPALAITVETGHTFVANDWIVVRGDDQDQIYVDKISAVDAGELTLTKGIPDSFTTGTVQKVNSIDVGSSEDQPFLAMAAVGKLADGSPVKLLIPKIRITKGFEVVFKSDAYGNLPFEASVYRPVKSDPFYADFKTQAAKIFAAS